MLMKTNHLSRRQFIERSVAAAGALAPASLDLARAQAATKRTAVDQVALGKRASSSAAWAWAPAATAATSNATWARKASTTSSITPTTRASPISTAPRAYRTFDWIGGAIKGLPREKLFIQSKIPGQPEKMLEAIDHHRKVFDTDYVDSMLIHCMIKDGWTDQWKRIMDGFDEAKEKKWIRAKGVSCHSLPALRAATASPWTAGAPGAGQPAGPPHGRHGAGSLGQVRPRACRRC